MKKAVSHYLALMLRGMGMGAADVIPGVSGGTIAFITGIYTELIDSLRSCDHRALQCLFSRGPLAAWQHINGNFLLAVFGGILLSIFALANIVTYWLEAQPVLLWSLFFGLILASAVLLLRQIPHWNPARIGLLLLGVLLAMAMSWLKPAHLPSDWWVVMLAGMVAICAMILPGISGGFLLLMMGLYSTIIGAVSELNGAILLPFAGGCVLGLLLFSHFLSWLLHRWEVATMALLTGILIGSLQLIWPWKRTLQAIENRHGEWVPLVQENIGPWQFEALTGAPSQWLWALLIALLGGVVVWAVEAWSARGSGHDKK